MDSQAIKAKLEERKTYLEAIIQNPRLEPQSSSYRYEHRVQLAEVKRILEWFE